MTYALIILALVNVAVLFLGHRRAVLRKRRIPSAAYFNRDNCLPPSMGWDADRASAARQVH